VWLPWVLVGLSAAAALFGAWWIWGTQAAVAFLAAWWPWMLIGASGAVTLSVLVWWLWWRLPKRQVDRLSAAITDAKARTDVEDNFRKTAGQLLGGAAVLIGAAIAYVQFTQQQETARVQLRTSINQFAEQQKTAREQSIEQQRAARDLLISNQVSKGFEQLGSDKVPVRLGGIYALEGVMNTSEQYHQPVLEALCAFVRDQPQPRPKPPAHPPPPPVAASPAEVAPLPATEVQAALTVIGRREVGGGRVDLHGAYIPNAVLRGADLRGANLSSADLSGANFGPDISGTLSEADYVALNKQHRANLSGADLFHANLSRTSLYYADLRGANLYYANLSDAGLMGADLSGASLIGAENLTQDQLDGACGDKDTNLNPPLTIQPCPEQ
jgi:hypothetical protein